MPRSGYKAISTVVQKLQSGTTRITTLVLVLAHSSGIKRMARLARVELYLRMKLASSSTRILLLQREDRQLQQLSVFASRTTVVLSSILGQLVVGRFISTLRLTHISSVGVLESSRCKISMPIPDTSNQRRMCIVVNIFILVQVFGTLLCIAARLMF